MTPTQDAKTPAMWQASRRLTQEGSIPMPLNDSIPNSKSQPQQNTIKERHPANNTVLYGAKPLPDDLLDILYAADDDFITIKALAVDALKTMLNRVSETGKWDDSAAGTKMMMWLLWRYPFITTGIALEAFPHYEYSQLDKLRGDLIHEAESRMHMRSVDHLKNMPYQEYLQSDHWQQIRMYALEDAGNRCQLCNSDKSLQVHHRTYERRGEEKSGDLIVLCAECHQHFHDKLKVQR